MKLVEDPVKGIVTIDDAVIIEGQIMDSSDYVCEKCKSEVIYYDQYDAMFCPKCNHWLEKKCGDPECCYCLSRPDKPISKQAIKN